MKRFTEAKQPPTIRELRDFAHRLRLEHNHLDTLAAVLGDYHKVESIWERLRSITESVHRLEKDILIRAHNMEQDEFIKKIQKEREEKEKK